MDKINSTFDEIKKGFAVAQDGLMMVMNSLKEGVESLEWLGTFFSDLAKVYSDQIHSLAAISILFLMTFIPFVIRWTGIIVLIAYIVYRLKK